MTEPAFEHVETFCPQRRCQAVLLLKKIKSTPATLLGVPVNCNFDKEACREAATCLLKALQILTRRKNQ